MLTTSLLALAVMLGMALLTWLVSIVRRDVSIVDVLWPLLLLAAALVHAGANPSPAAALIVGLVAVWGLRLALHILLRNRGRGEDRRYVAIRRKYSPNFGIKSLFIIFGFQTVLAWIISLPLGLAIGQPHVMHWSTGLAVMLFVAGFLFESIADAQLMRFRADPASADRVLDRGLWRYSRHPNYFGECLVWWAFWLLALPGGGWWTVFSPLLMTWLLLRFSGVTLLEHDIAERRPGYRDYVERTNAFIPGAPRARTRGPEAGAGT
jgi:steroid 5-alpha reductase family enzyme